MSPETHAQVSVERFWHLAHRLPKAELVAGQVIELAPPGFRHGRVAAAIGQRLREHVERGGLGVVVVEAGFILSPDPPTVRGPDVAVVLAAHVPSPEPVRFFPGPPDLAIEVLSPDDSPSEMAARVADYLRAAALAVWVVDPDLETCTVYTSRGATRYACDEVVEGAPVLPDLKMSVRELIGVSGSGS